MPARQLFHTARILILHAEKDAYNEYPHYIRVVNHIGNNAVRELDDAQDYIESWTLETLEPAKYQAKTIFAGGVIMDAVKVDARISPDSCEELGEYTYGVIENGLEQGLFDYIQTFEPTNETATAAGEIKGFILNFITKEWPSVIRSCLYGGTD